MRYKVELIDEDDDSLVTSMIVDTDEASLGRLKRAVDPSNDWMYRLEYMETTATESSFDELEAVLRGYCTPPHWNTYLGDKVLAANGGFKLDDDTDSLTQVKADIASIKKQTTTMMNMLLVLKQQMTVIE